MIRSWNRIASWSFGCALAASCAGGAIALAAESPSLPASAATSDRGRYAEKGAVVLELARFVEWPAPPPGAATSPFVVGVLGDERWSRAIRHAASGNPIQGRPVVVRSFRNLDEVDPCSILVVGPAKARLLSTVLEFLATDSETGILTIGDRPGFAASGGVVELLELPDRIGFEVNRDAARHAGLRLGAQLLRLAERLLPETDATPTR
jgi:hypothetical protein